MDAKRHITLEEIVSELESATNHLWENSRDENVRTLVKEKHTNPHKNFVDVYYGEIKMVGEYFAKVVTNLFLVIASHHLSIFLPSRQIK